MNRRFCYVTGTRADYGLMRRTLQRLAAAPGCELALCVTGMHLLGEHGHTVDEIARDGFAICAQVPADLRVGDGAAMALAIAHELIGFVGAFSRERPDVVLVLGDRGEMLAAAVAAIHLNIPVVHLHGGERSGTVDEPIRHAITKLAHYHFAATPEAAQRIVRMGEPSDHVWVTGAPGLDGLDEFAARPRAELCAAQQLASEQLVALVVYHPVLQTATEAGDEIAAVLDGVAAAGAQVLCLMPNADAGHRLIRDVLSRTAARGVCRLVTHFARDEYLSWLAAADVLVGNSSSGIIEAASFGLPVVNVGRRQHGRERNANTVDVPAARDDVHAAVVAALRHGRYPRINVYGDGRAAERIVGLLLSLPFPKDLLLKSNAY